MVVILIVNDFCYFSNQFLNNDFGFLFLPIFWGILVAVFLDYLTFNSVFFIQIHKNSISNSLPTGLLYRPGIYLNCELFVFIILYINVIFNRIFIRLVYLCHMFVQMKILVNLILVLRNASG